MGFADDLEASRARDNAVDDQREAYRRQRVAAIERLADDLLAYGRETAAFLVGRGVSPSEIVMTEYRGRGFVGAPATAHRATGPEGWYLFKNLALSVDGVFHTLYDKSAAQMAVLPVACPQRAALESEYARRGDVLVSGSLEGGFTFVTGTIYNDTIWESFNSAVADSARRLLDS